MEENKWFKLSRKKTAEILSTDMEKGLSQEEVQKRTEKYGRNELKANAKKTLIQKFAEQFKDVGEATFIGHLLLNPFHRSSYQFVHIFLK